MSSQIEQSIADVKINSKNKPFQIVLHLGIEKMDFVTLYTRYFVYRIWDCFYCKSVKIDWKKGLAFAFCTKNKCDFREKWEL